MINVRVRITIHGNVYWSSPIRNPAALVALIAHRNGCEVFDDEGHRFIAEACFEIARAEGRGVCEMRWGYDGRQTYRCDLAEMPRATGLLAPQIPTSIAATTAGDEPREFAGPTPDEVARHTVMPQAALPTMVFDHGGGRRRAASAVALRRVQPLLAPPQTWLERLLAWLFPGECEVRP